MSNEVFRFEDGAVDHYIRCHCQDTEHMAVMTYYEPVKEDDKEIYFHFHLAQHGFFRRLKEAIKYIFGYKCRYGMYDELLLTDRSIYKLQEYLTEFLEKCEAVE